MKKLDMEKIEEAMKRMIPSVDKSARLEAVVLEENEVRVIVAKGTQSDRATFPVDLMADFLKKGIKGQEVRKGIGKAISKLNRMSQRRG
jgi:ribosome-associated translation inhibitor RaiA